MLFRKKIQAQCAYCINSSALDEDRVQCRKKGIKNAEDKCIFFTYDPTKRTPHKAKALDFTKYEEYDYSL